MSIIKALLEKPPSLTTASKYTALNGFIYLAVGLLLIVWPGVTQTLFMDRPFAAHEEGLIRVIGLTVVVIGWLTFSEGVLAQPKSLPLALSTA